MPTKLTDDVRRVIELVEATGIAGRRGVLVLVFSRSGRGVAGYLNANPYNAGPSNGGISPPEVSKRKAAGLAPSRPEEGRDGQARASLKKPSRLVFLGLEQLGGALHGKSPASGPDQVVVGGC
jgi:hypothetical protein